jgi:hypothetical protein
MQLAIFAKKRKTKDGKSFYGYLSTMTRKSTGEAQTISVKFRDECGQPNAADCPCNIIVDKKDCNMSTRTFVREDTGEAATSYTLWVNKWAKGPAYVDHSLDDFE